MVGCDLDHILNYVASDNGYGVFRLLIKDFVENVVPLRVLSFLNGCSSFSYISGENYLKWNIICNIDVNGVYDTVWEGDCSSEKVRVVIV